MPPISEGMDPKYLTPSDRDFLRKVDQEHRDAERQFEESMRGYLTPEYYELKRRAYGR
jgi:hypothetical protein